MNILIDACSIINLYNADCLYRISELNNHEFWVGPIVLGECSGDCAKHVISLMSHQKLSRLNEDELGAERFLQLVDQFSLGPGETECLAAAEEKGFCICTDDNLARRATIELIGQNRLIGSARLLKWLVQEELMICEDASNCFDKMKKEGGYLPTLNNGFFCNS